MLVPHQHHQADMLLYIVCWPSSTSHSPMCQAYTGPLQVPLHSRALQAVAIAELEVSCALASSFSCCCTSQHSVAMELLKLCQPLMSRCKFHCVPSGPRWVGHVGKRILPHADLHVQQYLQQSSFHQRSHPCHAGAPCASGTVCRPARADTTSGFCLPDIWDATINKAGAGSSGGGVTGAWTGGVQGPNGAGLSTGSGQSPPPSPPPRTPTSTLRPVRAV